MALGTSVSASATTDTTGSRQYEPDYTCVDLHWAEDNVLEATQCEPEHNGPIVDSFDVEGRMLGAPVTFHCGYGFGIVDTIRGFDCERVRSSDRTANDHRGRDGPGPRPVNVGTIPDKTTDDCPAILDGLRRPESSRHPGVVLPVGPCMVVQEHGFQTSFDGTFRVPTATDCRRYGRMRSLMSSGGPS